MSRRWWAALAVLATLAPAHAALAQDGDRLRWYLSGRAGLHRLIDADLFRGVDADTKDTYGGSLGVNLNRYLGVEVAVDTYEPVLRLTGAPLVPTGGAKLIEYSTLTVIPQVRVRYPLLAGRLTPYGLLGVGWGHVEFSDRKPGGFGVRIRGDNQDTVVGAFGAGIEYFIASNLAVGGELKYHAWGELSASAGPFSGTFRPDSLLATASLRVLAPETGGADAGTAAPPAADTDALRLYLQFRPAAAVYPDAHVADGIALSHPELALGFSVGVNLNRYLGVEIAADGVESTIRFTRGPNKGKFGEYAVVAVMPQLRVRYPLLEGRLVPYVLAGLGVSMAEFNDRTSRVVDRQVDNGPTYAPAGAIGVGIEYFVASNIAVGAEARYVVSGGHDLDIQGVSHHTIHPSPLLLGAGLRLFLPEFWR